MCKGNKPVQLIRRTARQVKTYRPTSGLRTRTHDPKPRHMTGNSGNKTLLHSIAGNAPALAYYGWAVVSVGIAWDAALRHEPNLFIPFAGFGGRIIVFLMAFGFLMFIPTGMLYASINGGTQPVQHQTTETVTSEPVTRETTTSIDTTQDTGLIHTPSDTDDEEDESFDWETEQTEEKEDEFTAGDEHESTFTDTPGPEPDPRQIIDPEKRDTHDPLSQDDLEDQYESKTSEEHAEDMDDDIGVDFDDLDSKIIDEDEEDDEDDKE